MPRDYTDLPPNHVRKRDRAIEDDGWIRSFLRTAPYGVLATLHEGRPFVNSNLFVFDESAHALYLHTARVGRTAGNVRAGGDGVATCFSTFKMGRLLPAATALNFSVEYEGVTAFGRASILEDFETARYALQMLLDKYAPHLRPERDYHPITDEELERTAVYRINIDSWSGKRNEKPSDFPGRLCTSRRRSRERPHVTSIETSIPARSVMHYLLFYDVIDDYLERRSAYREDHLEHARQAFERGDLMLGGALANPVDAAVLLFRGDAPSVAEKFAEADPYVINGLVTAWRVREWSTVVGESPAIQIGE